VERKNRVSKLFNAVFPASVRKINKTANFIVLNVYAQIASRFSPRCLSSCRLIEFQTTFAVYSVRWMMPGLKTQDSRRSVETSGHQSMDIDAVLSPVDNGHRFLLGVLLGIVKFLCSRREMKSTVICVYLFQYICVNLYICVSALK